MNNSSRRGNFPLLRRAPGPGDFEVLLDLLPEAALLVELRSRRILLANATAIELSAYTRSELTGMDLGILFPNVEKHLFCGKKAGGGYRGELTFIKRNQSPLAVHANCTEMLAQGKWILISLTPVSELLQMGAERQRQSQQWESLQRLSAALPSSDLAGALDAAVQAGASLTSAASLSVYQAHGQNLELHRCASFGNSLPDQLPSQDLSQLRLPQLWTQGKRSLSVLHRAAREAGFSFLGSAPIGHPNAAIGLVAVAGDQAGPGENFLTRVQFLAGAITAIFHHHILVENLEQKIHSQAQALKMYETAQEAIQDAVIVISPDRMILRVNRSAEITLGYLNAEVRGQPVEHILIGSESIAQAIANAQRGLPTYGQGNSRLYRRSGEAFLAHTNVLPMITDGEVQGVVILIRDLSEKEQIQVHAQQLEQRALLGEVTAVFAHEVRNPINNISTGLQLMALNLPETDPNQEILGRLQQDCDRLGELMKSVLSFAHPSEYELEPVDLGLLVSRLLERVRAKITRANIRYHLQVEPAIPLVLGNPRALEQVFNNLVTNALQAMGDGGGTLAVKVQVVRTFGRRAQVEVTVADSGPGIAKELQERIFQPFFTTKPTGTGLGLAITKRIVTAHKGTIGVNSFPGGTVFHVQIPVAEGAEIVENQLTTLLVDTS